MIRLIQALVIELIETLWNVNEFDIRFSNMPAYELIETLWNVNFVTNK